MADLRLTQFFAGTISTTGYVTCYTVPAGHRAILKSAYMQNRSGTASATLRLRLDTFFILTHILGVATSATDHFELRPWLAMGPGQVLSASIQTAGPSVDLYLSGSLHYI